MTQGIRFNEVEATQMIGESTALLPDGWKCVSQLEPGYDVILDLDPMPFRTVESFSTRQRYPVQLEVTGHKIRFNTPVGTGVRVKIVFLRDGEPNVESRGWMKVGRY